MAVETRRPLSSNQLPVHFFHLLLLTASAAAAAVASTVSREDFPPGFIFGAGTSAYQVEGAAAEDGRKPSIWDTFAHAGKTTDGSTADITADQYHKYKEDVRLMYETGIDAYRFSISWSRLIPDGREALNSKGLEYYNNLINELISYGIEPHVTLYHFDLPQALQDEYGGELSPKIIEDFTAYADVCFTEFGDRVKHWSTFNEPNAEAVFGFDLGLLPPARCSYPSTLTNCSEGNSSTEPYVVAHHILLAHASAVELYRKKFQIRQRGKIGITILGFWIEPATDSPQDITAAKRVLDFHFGWFLHPLVHGDYPEVMKDNVGSRLPKFTAELSRKVKGSFDYIGLNHYYLLYVKNYPSELNQSQRDFLRDCAAMIVVPDVLQAQKFLPMVPSMPTPWALMNLLEYVAKHYGNPELIIHENGYGEFAGNLTMTYDTNDTDRVTYLESYIESLIPLIRKGLNVRGYFIWSFIDCFELTFGSISRFGIYGVDFEAKERRRYPRLSAHWCYEFLGGTSNRNEILSHLISE